MVNRFNNLVISFKSRVLRLRDRKIMLALEKTSIEKSEAENKNKKLDNKKKNDK